jgi:hypothetical protein
VELYFHVLHTLSLFVLMASSFFAMILCLAFLTLYSPVVTVCTARFNTQQFYVLPTQCVYAFCVDLRTNSDYFPIQHWLTGFCNRDGACYCAVRAESLTCNNSTFCPHSVFTCFVWISKQTAVISLYSINWLVFIAETECLLRGTSGISSYH